MKLRRRKQVSQPQPVFHPEHLTISTAKPPAADDAYWQPSGGFGSRREDAAEAERIKTVETQARLAQEEREADSRPPPPPTADFYFDGYCWRDRVDETREANRIARSEQRAAEQEAARGLPSTDGFEQRPREIRAANLL